jgi:endonuclease YncB( thermonuclease family)
MKKLIILLSLFLTTYVLATGIEMPIVRVIDGDTISTLVPLPCPLCRVSIRILGVDTPESTHRARCMREKLLGLEAKAAVIELVNGTKTMIVSNAKWDKYGGRINGNVAVNGEDIGKFLLEKGLAKPYTGVGKKHNWCVDQ